MALVCLPGISASAESGQSLTFDAVAAAYGVDVTASNPSLPFGLVIEGAGPVAQSHLSSLSQSDGLAAFPYPGEAANNLPALLKGTMLPGFPLPDNPLYVNSSLGTPPGDVSFPGVDLQARAEPNSSHARATAGTAAVGYVANSDISRTDDGVTATARTTANLLSLGNVLSLSGVESTAKAVLGSDGTVTKSSSLSIGRILAPGLNITLPESTPANPAVPVPIPGLPSFTLPFPAVPMIFGGTTLIAPDIGFQDGTFTISLPMLGSKKFALPFGVVLNGFKALGLDISVQKPVTTETAIVAPTLTVATTLPAPPENKYFNGPIPVKLVLGRTTASFQSVSVEPAAPTVPGFGGGIGGDTGAGAGPGGSGGVLPPDETVEPSAPSFDGGDFPGDGGDFPGDGGDSSPLPGALDPGSAAPGASGDSSSPMPPTEQGRLRTLSLQRKLLPSLVPLYVAVVGMGVIGLFAGQFLRYLGVRSSWKS